MQWKQQNSFDLETVMSFEKATPEEVLLVQMPQYQSLPTLCIQGIGKRLLSRVRGIDGVVGEVCTGWGISVWGDGVKLGL